HDMIKPLINFIRPEDMIIFISLNGEAPELVDFAKAVKMKGVYSASITKMVSSSLSRLCDENLYIQSISVPIDGNLEYEGTTPYFILIELLYIKYKLYFSDVNILP
ncbi:MAG: SIS domain-containing protein, partial [Eubacterium sp.]